MATCNCGRNIGILPHCINCGSPSVYARKVGDKEIVHNGVTITSRGFRCRRCGEDFDEMQACNAPPLGGKPETTEINVA